MAPRSHDANAPAQVLYLLGHEHCGSTILEHYLNQHPQVLAAGEIADLSTRVPGCSCGVDPFLECPFWRQVDRECRAAASHRLADIDPAIADRAAFRENNELLFAALARAAGAEMIIDASKGPIRLARLLRETRLRVNVVHITRPFADYAFSHKKKYNVGFQEIVSKFADYLSHLRKGEVARGAPLLEFLRFEDFLANPEQLRRSLLRRAGLDADCGSRGKGPSGFHSIGGNNIRFSPEPLSRDRSKVRYEAFSVHQRIALHMLHVAAELFRPRSSIIERDA